MLTWTTTQHPFSKSLGLLFVVAMAASTQTGCKMAADGQNLQGVRLLQQGQYDGAMQHFQKAVATDPSNADAYYNMAATTHRMGAAQNDQKLLAQAETLYNQCLDLNENHEDCYRALAVLLVETGRSDKAFNLLRNWANRNPNSADARIELARLSEEFGDTESATTHLTEALQIDPNNARAYNALGRIREQAGDYAQALANYQRSFNINRFQAQIGERIAALNNTLAGSTPGAVPSGTRTVDASQTTPIAR